MIVPDTNLLMYATVVGFSQHRQSRKWLESVLNGDERVGLTDPVIYAFIRLTTSARVLADPMSSHDATNYVRTWLARPHVEHMLPTPHHREIVFKLLADSGAAGNLTTDAQIAAHALLRKATVYTNDSDFARFPGLAVVNPLAATEGP